MSALLSARSRLACVSIEDFGLQIVLRRAENSASAAWALVDRPGPQGKVVSCTAIALRAGVRVGMRVRGAEGLCSDLRVVNLEDEEVESIVEELCEVLGTFSPRVEPGPLRSGAFWIDPAGMERLYGPPAVWAAAIVDALETSGWRAAIVVGFRRFLTRALAERSEKILVLETPEDEVEAAAVVRLSSLDLPARRLSALAAIEVSTLGDLLRLPAGELRARFGAEVAALHADASGACWRPLCPRERPDPIAARIVIDPPEEVDERLLFAVKGILPGLIDRLVGLGSRVSALELELVLIGTGAGADTDTSVLRVELAEPTDNLLQILDLLRLRIGSLSLASAVCEVGVVLEGVRPSTPQIDLLAREERRDPRAAERALDRVRAAYGEESVTRAALRDAHLPEASFAWEPARQVSLPRPSSAAANLSGSSSCLIRRVLRRPLPLGATVDQEGDDPPRAPSLAGALPAAYGRIRRLHGPHRVSGGWWVRPVERDYYYAETTGDEILWIFYDRPRRRWFLQGVVD